MKNIWLQPPVVMKNYKFFLKPSLYDSSRRRSCEYFRFFYLQTLSSLQTRVMKQCSTIFLFFFYNCWETCILFLFTITSLVKWISCCSPKTSRFVFENLQFFQTIFLFVEIFEEIWNFFYFCEFIIIYKS